jgi:putative FmdB family regulatory protein
MPIYEYQCHKCGVIEVTQRITEAPLKKCPTCKSKVERLVSRSSFVLKGSGWYATDYANKGKSSSESTSDSTSTSTSNGNASSSSDSKKTESKPAASESKPAASAKAAD